MKTEFKPKIAVKGFYLPDEIVEDTTLKEADTIDFYSNSSSILIERELHSFGHGHERRPELLQLRLP